MKFLCAITLGVIIGFSLDKFLFNRTLLLPFPECFSGRCPDYSSFDVTGDGVPESLVIIPTAMTQGSGKLIVIQKGNVIFESNEYMQISVYSNEGDGMVLRFADEANSSASREKKYKYRNGVFTIID